MTLRIGGPIYQRVLKTDISKYFPIISLEKGLDLGSVGGGDLHHGEQRCDPNPRPEEDAGGTRHEDKISARDPGLYDVPDLEAVVKMPGHCALLLPLDRDPAELIIIIMISSSLSSPV